MSSTEPNDKLELRQLIDEHQVVFEVAPVRVARGGEFSTIGYDVLLFGRHERTLQQRVSPGCGHCWHVWQHLARIARDVVPDQKHSSFTIQPYRPALEYEAHGEHAVYVRLVIEIRHVTAYDSPADECEAECLAKITGALKALGVRARNDH